jgi:hypothetical protein
LPLLADSLHLAERRIHLARASSGARNCSSGWAIFEVAKHRVARLCFECRSSVGVDSYFEAVQLAHQCIRRYFQAQGLMHVPSLIIVIIAPINAVLNWILVWGPQPIRLG